jgi:hypothetical protein
LSALSKRVEGETDGWERELDIVSKKRSRVG